jgi:transcriptional regulator with XRE-family HTH domain
MAYMATSQQKSKVAQTRLITGETAEAFADIIGKSLSTLRSLETGRLKLSEKTALDISRATGVSLRWLLDDKTTPPTCDGTLPPEPFTKESYVAHAAKKRQNSYKVSHPELNLMLGLAIRDIATAFYSAAERGNGDIALYYLEKFAEDLGKQFPPPQDRTKAARALIFLGESLIGDGVADEDEQGGSGAPATTPQKKQPSRKSKRPA